MRSRTVRWMILLVCIVVAWSFQEDSSFMMPSGVMHSLAWNVSSYKAKVGLCPNSTFITKKTTAHLIECLSDCSQTSQCHGVLVNDSTANEYGSFSCFQTTVSVLSQDAGWYGDSKCTYYERKSNCSMFPRICQNGGKCIPDFEAQSYTCVCPHIAYHGVNCQYTRAGYLEKSPAKSCLTIKLDNTDTEIDSGYYWIKGLPRQHPIKMFCDMETDGGGWTKIAHVDSRQTVKILYTDWNVSEDLTTLSNVNMNYYALSSSRNGLGKLRQLINFSQIRFYCHKPAIERLLHIMTSNEELGKAALDYFTGYNTTERPLACNSFRRLPDDTSIISQRCDEWGIDGRWHISPTKNNIPDSMRLYSHPIFISWVAHIELGYVKKRLECDDYRQASEQGLWMYYVR